jgi:hypothetical protein
MEKRRKLREERDCFDISQDLDEETGVKKTVTAKSGRDERRDRKRKVLEKFAVLPFVLKDYEVHEDMNILKQVCAYWVLISLVFSQAAAFLQIS